MKEENRCKWCNLNNPKYIEYHDNECFIGVILVVAEQYCGTHRQSERVGGVCRKESEETASVFQDMQSAEQHLAAVAWT